MMEKANAFMAEVRHSPYAPLDVAAKSGRAVTQEPHILGD